MSTVLGCPQVATIVEAPLPSDEAVRRQVWQILSGLGMKGHNPERRSVQRFPYASLLYLTPVGSDGISPGGESIVVVGKHLSERGLGFFYQQPIPNRRMIASLECQELRFISFLIDITWCRFTRHGWYDSGGRFLQTVPSPIAAGGR